MVNILRIRGEVAVRWVKWVRELKRGSRQRVSKAEQNKVYSSEIELHLRQTHPSYRKAGRKCRHMLGSELDTQNLPGAWNRWRLGPRHVRKSTIERTAVFPTFHIWHHPYPVMPSWGHRSSDASRLAPHTSHLWRLTSTHPHPHPHDPHHVA